MKKKFKGTLFVQMVQRYLIYFFVDDSLQFCKASLGDVTTIQNILEVYESASGQQINKKKTTLFFGKSVNERVKNSVKELGVLEIK